MNKLLILSREEQTYHQLLQQAQLPDIEIASDPTQAEIVLADPPLVTSHLPSLTNLDWLQSTFAGVDSLTNPDLRQDYQLTNVRGIFGQQISEYVLGYTISYSRHCSHYHEQQKKACWSPKPYQSLLDKTIVILGTGSIGSHLAHSCKALGLTIYGVNRTGIPPRESQFHQVFHLAELKQALSMADIVVSTLPKTEQTVNLLNQDILCCCRHALLFSVGRGEVVEQPGLLAALEMGSISHAFLDVFPSEPLEQQHPYWHHPKITVTPHIAAVSFPEQVFEIFKENYLRWKDGFNLRHIIDFDKGY